MKTQFDNLGDAYYNRNRVREFLEDKPGAIADYQKAAELYQKDGNTNDYQDALKICKYYFLKHSIVFFYLRSSAFICG